MTPDDASKVPFFAAPRGRRLAGIVFVFVTTALVGIAVIAVVLAIRMAVPPTEPGPRDMSAYTSVDSLAVSDNSERAAAAGRVGYEVSFRVWDIRSGRPTRAREYRPRHFLEWIGGRKVGLSPDGQMLA